MGKAAGLAGKFSAAGIASGTRIVNSAGSVDHAGVAAATTFAAPNAPAAVSMDRLRKSRRDVASPALFFSMLLPLLWFGNGFQFRTPGLRPQAANEVHNMPNLLILKLVFVGWHVILGALADTRKNRLGRNAMLPFVRVGKVGRRSAV